MSEFEFKGTPGPWGAAGNGINDSRGKQVCRCPMGKHNTVAGRQWGANARAIAVVPELIEALDDARDWIDACGAQGGLQEILDKIESALTKATGGNTDDQ